METVYEIQRFETLADDKRIIPKRPEMSAAQSVVMGNGQTVTMSQTSSGTIIFMPMVHVPPAAHIEKYRYRQSIGTGLCQVLVGILCIIFNAVGLGFSYPYSRGSLYVGHGFWIGILFIIAGALGVSAGQTKLRCKIIAYTTISILSACGAGIMFAIAVPGAVTLVPGVYDCRQYSMYPYNYYGSACVDTNSYRVALAMHVLIAILAVTEAVLAIWGSAIGCRVVCYCGPAATQGVAVSIPASYLPGNGQVMYISQVHGTPYVYNPSLPYPSGQGPAVEAVGPPPYQASFTQAAWTQPPPSLSPPLYYPPTSNYGGSEHHSRPANPHSADESQK